MIKEGITSVNHWEKKELFPISTPIKANGEYHKEFRKVLMESIKNGRPVLISNTERYRASGKTSVIANYLNFVEDSCLFVPYENMRELYVREYGIEKERIIVTRNLNHIRSYTNCKNFIMDEIPLKDYNEIRLMVCPIKDAKLSGVVTIYEDYLIL